MFQFKKAPPEACGIQSDHIFTMISRLNQLDISMHSIILMRNDTILYEGYYKPYNENKLHRMFSISKTLTSIAIGHLITDGKIHLDDHIVDYFPEKCPKDIHPWIKAMTIRNMLEMRTCHSQTTYKHNLNSDWVSSFFHVKPDHPAGTVFHYDTSSPHVLCALVEKLTQKPLYQYVKEDIMPELELSEEGFMLPDPFGVSMGGSGLCCKPMDLLKIGHFLLHNGTINGASKVDSDYLAHACSNINPTVVKAGNPSESLGYGYQIWQHDRNGFVAYGMGGQYIFVCPKENLILVTTADTQGYGGANYLIHNTFFEEILDKISLSPLPENPDALKRLEEYSQNLQLPLIKGTATSSYINDAANATYHLEENPLGFSNAIIQCDHASQTGILSFKGDDKQWDFHFGLGHMTDGLLPDISQYYTANAAWLTDQVLYIKGHICDTSVGSFHIQLHFVDDQLTVFYKVIEETLAATIPAGHLIGYKK